jgi:hypothetical protein
VSVEKEKKKERFVGIFFPTNLSFFSLRHLASSAAQSGGGWRPARAGEAGAEEAGSMAADKWSDQIRACGLFFISIVVLMVIPLVYHCFVFLTALPLWGVNTASCVILLVCFHTLFLLLVVSYWKVIFTDAGGVPYELDEAWVSPRGPWCREPLGCCARRCAPKCDGSRCWRSRLRDACGCPPRILGGEPRAPLSAAACGAAALSAVAGACCMRRSATLTPGPPRAHVLADFRAKLGAPIWP